MKLNVTAILTIRQVEQVVDALEPSVPAVISIFAGRIADTGCDPGEVMRQASRLIADRPNFELLWVACGSVQIFQAGALRMSHRHRAPRDTREGAYHGGVGRGSGVARYRRRCSPRMHRRLDFRCRRRLNKAPDWIDC